MLLRLSMFSNDMTGGEFMRCSSSRARLRSRTTSSSRSFILVCRSFILLSASSLREQVVIQEVLKFKDFRRTEFQELEHTVLSKMVEEDKN